MNHDVIINYGKFVYEKSGVSGKYVNENMMNTDIEFIINFANV